MLRFRAVAATLVALHIGLLVATAAVRLGLRVAGLDPRAVTAVPFHGPLFVLLLPVAAVAGLAGVQAAAEPSRGLVAACAAVAAAWAAGWTAFEVGFGLEPPWFRYAVPPTVFATAWLAGRWALLRGDPTAA